MKRVSQEAVLASLGIKFSLCKVVMLLIFQCFKLLQMVVGCLLRCNIFSFY